LSRFTPQDFLAHVEAAGIAWHEKALGQLFCDGSSQQIIDLLIGKCRKGGAKLWPGTEVKDVEQHSEGFRITTGRGPVLASRVVIATGGKSIPKIGATGFGYDIARQFGLNVIEPRPALVPLTFEGAIKEMAKNLAGVSVEASVMASTETGGKKKRVRPTAFRDGFLFTHRGLSGPSILQVSSYWREGGEVAVDLSPGTDLLAALRAKRSVSGRTEIRTALGQILPKRLAAALCAEEGWSGNLADWSDKKLGILADRLHHWRVTPSGSEGYRTAEVTLGGVDTNALNSRTMEAKTVPGLFFIGEVVDVTGWLGGYNFQWAWASAFAAAEAMAFS
jgi:predicted Rossmann fold flavoprotein